MKQKDCFIISPISTPDEIRPLYGGDSNHFIHVIKELVVPAIKKAGFNPIEPIMRGSDVIHAQIIRNLEEAPLVLCDISSLNPNVMLELGIRTALNKPVCIIKDDVTVAERVPFDLAIINNHTYQSDPTWTLADEIERLATHVKGSTSDNVNALWKYFGFKLTAQPSETKSGEDSQLQVLLTEIAALRKEVKASKQQESFRVSPPSHLGPVSNLGGFGYVGPVSTLGPTGYSGYSGIQLDYLPMLLLGMTPSVPWLLSGSSVGNVMKQLYEEALKFGLDIKHLYFNSGMITMKLGSVDMSPAAKASLESIANAAGLLLSIEPSS